MQYTSKIISVRSSDLQPRNIASVELTATLSTVPRPAISDAWYRTTEIPERPARPVRPER